jgi:hypothetical protein
VHALSDDEIRSFHLHQDQLQLAYAPLLLARRLSGITEVMLIIIDQLNLFFPEQSRLLTLLRDDLLWRARVAPIGGDV